MEYLLIEDNDVPKIHKDYLFEACECASRNNMLAAIVMLGASAELLLIDLCESFGHFIKKEKTETEYDSYVNKVINAKSASLRLQEFKKRAVANPDVFKPYDFENIEANLSFLDIIRTNRNDAGHPTGNKISKDEFKIILSAYRHFLPRVLELIEDFKILY